MPPRPHLLRPFLLRPSHPSLLSSLIPIPPLTSSAGRRTYSAAVDPTNSPLILRSDLPAVHTGHIRVLELNRPGARNAISLALLSCLAAEIADVHAQYGPDGEELTLPTTFGSAANPSKRGYTRALVLASAVDESFCAGADLKERKGMSREETDLFLKTLRKTLASLSLLPIPTISAISSLALGGGLEVALSTHFRVLASTASVGLPETRLGIIPGAGGTYRLPALIGVGRARDLIVTGRRVSAAEAYFLGIADRLVEVLLDEAAAKGMSEAEAGKLLLGQARTAALSEAVKLAQEISEGGPVAIRAGLKAVNYARVEVENEMYERVVDTEDRNEALAAFREKRKPIFKGK